MALGLEPVLQGVVAAAMRYAVPADLPAIIELHVRAGDLASPNQIEPLARNGQFLVLDRLGGGLAAAIHLRINGACGYVARPVLAPDLVATPLAAGVIAVAEATCVAQGCTAVVRRR